MSQPPPDALPAVAPVIDLFEQLHVPYHVGGSFAIAAHGLPRASADVDVVAELTLGQVDGFVAALEDRYYVNRDRVREAIVQRGSFNLVDRETSMKVDVFIPEREAFAAQEQARARPVRFGTGNDARELFVKSREDLVLRKLRWYRDGNEVSEKQWTDVVGLLTVQAGRLDVEYLRHWATDLGVTDLLERAMADVAER